MWLPRSWLAAALVAVLVQCAIMVVPVTALAEVRIGEASNPGPEVS